MSTRAAAVPTPLVPRLPWWAAPGALLLLLAAAALAAGLALARPSLGARAASAEAAAVLQGFSDIDSSGEATYRWSLPKAEIDLQGLARRPVLLTLRMAAPRPPDAPAAVTFLTDDVWRLGDFTVTGDWRRYQLLLPAADRPVKLRVVPFVPGESDARELGITLADVRAATTALTSEAAHAWAILGAPRAVTLALLPLLLYVALGALSPPWRGKERAAGAGLIVPLLTLPLVTLSAAYPLQAAVVLPETWLLPGALALALALGVSQPLVGALSRRLSGVTLERRVLLALVAAGALGQGLLFVFLVPPWQHYDEPAHFEYVRLIADRRTLPEYGDRDPLMQREITASMIEHDFYEPEIPVPPLLNDAGGIYLSGGFTATGHPPPYYVLASLPLAALPHLDVTTQLLMVRGVSLLFFLASALAAAGIARELAPAESPVRWLLPLGVVLCASYADSMTSVNNDSAAAACVSLFLWSAVRVIRRGISWRRMAVMLVAALAAAAFKNTGAVALALAPVAVVIALWAQRGWRWRWLVAGIAAGALVAILATISWDDARAWYRWAWPSQPGATRVALAGTPLGDHVLRLQVQPETTGQRLSNPLLGRDLAAVRGQRVTVGAWVWATRPITLSHGVLINTGGADEPRTEPIALGTEPRFFAWTTSVPEGAQRLQYVVGTDAWSESLEVYVDGAVVVRARPPLDEVPSFDGPGERSVMWGGKSYNNLLRNGSAEEGGPRFRAWLDRPLAYYARRSLSTTLVSILDLERTGRLTFLEVAPGVVDMFFSRFGWGGSLFPGWGWQIVFRGVALLSLAGCAAWLLRRVRLPSPSLPALAFLGLTALVIWGNVVLRIHPLIDTAMPLTSARYGFPAIIPTVLALVGGWLALWPARLRGYGVTLVVVGTLALNVLAVLRIWELYYG